MNRAAAYATVIVSESLGAASLVLFGWFVVAGPWVTVRLGFSEMGALAWDAMLSLLFFVQHSVMVRRAFKDWLASRVARDFHGAIYSIASGVALTVAMVLWQRGPTVVVALSGFAHWAVRALAVAAFAGFIWGVRSLRSFDGFGRRPIAARLRGKPLVESPLVVRGAYQWVRHPLMFFMLVFMWSNPVVTSDRALFNVLWTVWLVVGSFWEEQDLVAEFGADYQAYRRVVPMLIPWRGPVGRTFRR